MLANDVNQLRQHFISNVKNQYPNMVVVYDNQPNVTPPTNDAWCRFLVKPTSKRRVQLGSTKKYEQIGLATLQIIVPPQTGDAAGYAIADKMDAAFKEWRSIDGAMIVTRTDCSVYPSTPSEPHFIINFHAYWKSIRT